jgi:starvation-inducible DNA-binding protein
MKMEKISKEQVPTNGIHKMKPNIGIAEKNLESTSSLLSEVLSNEMVLYIKTRKAHWNVTGESFMELHKLFENQYKQLEEAIDEVAERIGKLGHKTIGTMYEFLKHASIRETPGEYASSKDMLKELLKDHEAVITQLRKYITDCAEKNKDAGTADFLTGLMEQHETTAWILRRYLN